jgi:hypothetical protein
VILSAIQDATEGQTVAVTDIPGAFLNAKLEELVHMVLIGPLADLLIEAVPDVYAPYATKNILTRALYGCLKSALQFWKHLSSNLLAGGDTLNKYDTYVANKIKKGSQCTITWYVDDLKVSHVDKQVVHYHLVC